MPSEPFELTGAMDGYALRFRGRVLRVFPTWNEAARAYRAVLSDLNNLLMGDV